jgi:hypothetical protein
MPEPTAVNEADDRCVVVVDADERTARAAEAAGARMVFVQKPGSVVDRLVWRNSNRCFLYSVDHTTERFTRFVTEILGPIAPAWVLAGSPEAVSSAATARALLGLPDSPGAAVARLVQSLVQAGAGPATDQERSAR